MPSIYRKTAKGQSEIETRAHRLAPRLRTALIMVDGKRSDGDLRPLLLQAPDETLATLLEQGFIEPVAGGTSSAALASPYGPVPSRSPAPLPAPAPALAPALAPAPASAPASVPASVPATTHGPTAATTPRPRPMPVPLPTLQRDAVRQLTDQVGPMGEAVAIRIERSRSTDELRAAVLLAAQVIANTRGRQAAEVYVARYADL